MTKQPSITETLGVTGGVIPPGHGTPSKTRVGKKGIITYQPPAVAKQLKALALEHDKAQQELLAEALNLLFQKYGKSQIAS
jgi:hypothetical protein